MNRMVDNNKSVANRLIEMVGIRKSFPGVQAISIADFDLNKGEIHALVGENGAGKSTLIKILTGVQSADEGEIKFEGRAVNFRTPLEAQLSGIATIYQELTLVPALSVAANIFLGQEKCRRGMLDHRNEHNKSIELLKRLGAAINPDRLVSELSVAHQQIVEIARALARDAKVLVMDEPTAALSPQEVSHLFVVLNELTSQGIGVIFISHRLDEVLSISDRITVMRDGKTIDTRPVVRFSRTELIEQMVGRSIEQEFPKVVCEISEKCFEVRKLSNDSIKEISFVAHRGEVLGIAGLMGAGRTEVARMIFGADRKNGGILFLDGNRLEISNPHDAIENGLCLLTEDRKAQGLVLGASVKDNFSLTNLSKWSSLGWIDKKCEQERFAYRSASMNIQLAHQNQKAEELSGGNQQKLLLARWLETNSEIIIFDEPTRGIDVGAKYDIYLLIGKLAAEGKVVIVISSELPELLGICDRILVMRRGKLSGEINDMANATPEQIMALAV